MQGELCFTEQLEKMEVLQTRLQTLLQCLETSDPIGLSIERGKEWKQDLVNHPLITPPPLLLQTVHGPLYCDLFKTYCSIWWMLNLI